MNDASQLLSAAQLAADRAADFLRDQEGRMKPSDWTAKGKADYVTEVDRESERLVREALLGAFPASTVVGEELSPELINSATQSGVAWVVDPLDGTTNFLHRFPTYAVSIAATVNGKLTAGLVHHVPLDVRFHATAGGGAWKDAERIQVSANIHPAHALIGTGVPFRDMSQWPAYHAQIEAIAREAAGIRRPGSAALDLCDVAAGRTEGFWELKLAPWDIAAGTLIVREAGGVVTDLAGDADILRHTGVVAGNPAIHAWLLQTLATMPG